MKEKEQWKNLLAVEGAVPYEERLEETQRLARDVRPAFAGRCQLSFRGFMVKQIKFIAWKIWFWQGMVLALLCAVFFSIYGIQADEIPGSMPGGTLCILPENVPRFLCGCSGIIAVCVLPILQRSIRCRMFEVERATRFSVRGGLAAQLLFIGVGDMGMLSVLAFLSMRAGVSGKVVFLFGVIPFLTATVTALMLWMRRKPCVSVSRPLLLCIVSVCAAYEIVNAVSCLLPDGILWFGILYTMLCVCAIGWEYRRLISKEKEGVLLWKSY
ncbi:MAG: hypothetical protein K2N80_10930 [Lachnospiraceae bacterium]|nr:hypothetical protein [Lachnospiraceae bacterium]